MSRKKVHFTDADKFPFGYQRGADVAETFRRVRLRLKAEQKVVEEVKAKVRSLRKKTP